MPQKPLQGQGLRQAHQQGPWWWPRENSRVQLAASCLYGRRAAQFVEAEQGPVSAGEAVPVTGSQVRRGPGSSAGLAGSKVR